MNGTNKRMFHGIPAFTVLFSLLVIAIAALTPIVSFAESPQQHGPMVTASVLNDAEDGSSELLELTQAVVYHGNVKSKVFHRPGCRYYHCKNCVKIFATRDEALAAGYRPCKICQP